jgi:hypothetical protein
MAVASSIRLRSRSFFRRTRMTVSTVLSLSPSRSGDLGVGSAPCNQCPYLVLPLGERLCRRCSRWCSRRCAPSPCRRLEHRRKLVAARSAGLSQDSRDVRLHRSDTQTDMFSDLPVRHAAADHLGDLDFPGAEPCPRHAGGSGVHLHVVEHSGDVLLGRVWADAQLLADLLRAVPLRHEQRDLLSTFAQPRWFAPHTVQCTEQAVRIHLRSSPDGRRD